MQRKQPEIDPETAALAEYMRRLASYDAFDKLIDMALDQVITMDEAITAFREDWTILKDQPQT